MLASLIVAVAGIVTFGKEALVEAAPAGKRLFGQIQSRVVLGDGSRAGCGAVEGERSPVGDQQRIEINPASSTGQRQNVAQVLKSLNYSKQEISAAIHYLNEQYPAVAIPFDQLMRHALGFLAKHK